MKKIHKIIDSLYARKCYIDILHYLNTNQSKSKEDCLNFKQVAIEYLGYAKGRESKFDEICSILINCGYMSKSKDSYPQLYITDEGKIFLQDYFRFSILGFFGKFTQIFNRNLIGIISIISIIIAICSLILSIIKNSSLPQ